MGVEERGEPVLNKKPIVDIRGVDYTYTDIEGNPAGKWSLELLRQGETVWEPVEVRHGNAREYEIKWVK
jgi:hypothetical protein